MTTKDPELAAGDLELAAVTKRFGGAVVVDDLHLRIPAGQFFALLGPSGCGKTTTLRMVAGLEQPDAGRISLSGVDITEWRSFKRPVNTVFQSYALFPHLNIYDNVAFGLRERKRKDVDQQVKQVLRTVELTDLARRKPTQLSGGQQQRVALARAIVNRPQVLLLDEPLGALDLKLRRQMQSRLKQIQSSLGLTFLHVTHDQEEAMTIADTIAVMNQGRIEQMGSPEELYESPRTAFVANFLGNSNLLPGEVVGRSGVQVDVALGGSTLRIPAERVHGAAASVFVGVRPEKLHLSEQHPATSGHNEVSGTVTESAFTGIGTEYAVLLDGTGHAMRAFVQNRSARQRLAPGTRVVLHWEVHHTFALDGAEDPTAGQDDGAGDWEVEPAVVGAP